MTAFQQIVLFRSKLKSKRMRVIGLAIADISKLIDHLGPVENVLKQLEHTRDFIMKERKSSSQAST